jgi:cysteine desulfurase family protein (TIGR01976 family)
MSLDIDFVRSQFPGLSSPWVLFDNAGGSQILGSAVERISDYLINSNVQHGASYDVSALATQRVDQAQADLARFINAARPEEVVLGSSSSMLLKQLADSMPLAAGDEIIITNFDHAANISPWMRLREQGVVVKTWQLNPNTLEVDLDELRALFTPRTRLLCVSQTTNIMGAIYPVETLAELAHRHGAQICVDAVAYAPHRIIDVSGWDVDYYVFSLYKVYGPHQALMYAKYENLCELANLNHSFLSDSIPYKLQPGNVNYELTYASAAVVEYLETLGRRQSSDANLEPRAALQAAYAAIGVHEEMLSELLLEFLRSRNNVQVIGPTTSDAQTRVPKISFVADNQSSNSVVEAMDAHKIGIRFGDFYATRLIDDLNLRSKNGVIRVSMVHYNTREEVSRLISHLGEILD